MLNKKWGLNMKSVFDVCK